MHTRINCYSGTITIKEEGVDDASKKENERNKVVVFKIGVLLNDCVSN